jgi:hypothetical protein
LRALLLGLLGLAVACAEPAPDDGIGGSDASDGSGGSASCDPADTDGDGLTGCDEQALGTDPDVADTDGDGLSDSAEADCVSDPLDPAEQCYACGWAHGDPGDLESSGASEGDVIKNVGLVDQCGERVDLWDFHGAWRVALLTTEWCSSCRAEAGRLQIESEAFAAAHGVSAPGMVILFESSSGGLPTADTAARYAETIGADGFPVLADLTQEILTATPWEYRMLPGVCLLDPDLRIVACESGDGHASALLDQAAGEL